MRFSLDVIRARKGDCLMLHFGSPDDPHLVMIDGGPRGVYKDHLRPRIDDLRKARGLGDAPLPVDLLMVSHVDDDHINGILDLTKEMIEADKDHRPRPVRIFGLWHNSFDNLIGNTPKELLSAMHQQFGPASTEGELPDVELEVEDMAHEEVQDSLQVLSSIRQGAQLRRDTETLAIDLNPDFNGELIIARPDLDPVDFDGLSFTVVGPMKADVEALQEDHDKWLEDLAKHGKTPGEVLAAFVDPSVPNLSSLVLLAEADGKRMLLTGDARGDKILEGLQLTGLLAEGDDSMLHVDLLKVPHHGSANNLETGFFRSVTADHYVFSGNGEHGNPERESLEMLRTARGDDAYAIHLTYPIADIDVERKKEWDKQQAREKKRRETKPTQHVREDWSPQKHSLAALFAADPAFAAKVRVVEADEPHLIDLLDPVTL